MATQYPNNIDTTGTLPYVVDGVSPVVAADVNRLRDTLVAIESELGASPSGANTTVADRLAAFEATFTSFAPESATYLVLNSNVSLSNERIFTAGQGLEVSDSGAGGAFTVGLTATGVTAGLYRQPAFDIDGYGRIVSVNEGTFSSAAGIYESATVEVDGYGRVVSVAAGSWRADGYDVFNTNDGYVGVLGRLLVDAAGGTAAVPSIAFFEEEGTGFYYSSGFGDPAAIGFAAGGMRAFEFNEFSLVSGSVLIRLDAASAAAGSPVYSFASDTSAGLASLAAGTIGLQTTGTTRFSVSTTSLSSTLPFLFPVGTAGAPSITFTGDTSTGAYRNAAGKVGFSSAGTLSVQVDGYGIKSVAGYDGYPSHSFLNDTDTGVYNIGANQIGFAAGGVIAASINGGGVKTVAGSALLPSYSFLGNTNDGMYHYNDGTDHLGFAVDGVKTASIDVAGIKNLDGASVAPSYGFSSDTDTGMFLLSANILGLSAGGTGLMYLGGGVAQGYATSSFQLYSGVPSAVNPAYSFVSDTNTGIYNNAADELATSTGGASCRFVNRIVSTADATPTAVWAMSTTSNNTYLVEYLVVARSNAVTINSASYHGTILARNNAGTLILYQNPIWISEDEPAWSFAGVVSGSNVNMTVTGEIGVSINWASSFRIISVSNP